MKFSSKAWLLIALGGAMLSPGLMLTLAIVASFKNANPDVLPGYVNTIQEFALMFLLGAVMTGIAGVPFLYFIEKYFSRYRLRYVVGSLFASYVLWSLLNSCPFMLNCDWEMHRDYRVDLYLGTGLATGIVFTLLVRWIERKK